MDTAHRIRAGLEGASALAGLVGTVIVVSLLWMTLAVLVLPLPAATAALFASVGRAVEGRAGNPFADFLGGLRTHWRQASGVGAPALVLGVVIGVDALSFLSQPSAVARGFGWLFASLFFLWCALLLLFWPALVCRDLSWRRLVKESFWLTMGTLPWRLATAAAAALVILLAVLYPVLIPFVPGVVALIGSWSALRTFRRYGLAVELHS
ncbi:MAG: DUF624 domain-containing protein [Thermomicrobiales bacterium]